MKTLKIIGTILVATIVIGSVIAVAIGWTVFQWKECRDSGLTKAYCIQHVL